MGFGYRFHLGGFSFCLSVVGGRSYEQKEQRLQELRHAYIDALEISVKYHESSDRYTKVHSVRISGSVSETAIAMELRRTEVETILFRSYCLFTNFQN